MPVHLAVATALCTANIVEIHPIMTVEVSAALIEVEGETNFGNEVQTETVGVQVLVEAVMSVGCPRQAPRWSSMIQTFAKEPSRVRTAEQTSSFTIISDRSTVLSRTLFVGGVT